MLHVEMCYNVRMEKISTDIYSFEDIRQGWVEGAANG